MPRPNVIFKAFDSLFSKPMLERAFEGRGFGTCIHIVNDLKEFPTLDAEETIVLSAQDQRAGRYGDVDWSQIRPLEAPLIAAMREYEAVFLTMIERYGRTGDIPYQERRQQYLDHLRYWNHMLLEKKIDLYFMNALPHQCYDWVIYGLCKHYGIATYHLDRSYIVDSFYLVSDWENAGDGIRERFDALSKDYASTDDVPLTPKYEEYFKTFTKTAKPWYAHGRSKDLAQKNFTLKWIRPAADLLMHKPLKLLSKTMSPEVWKRKWEQHRTALLYDAFTEKPDLTKPFIYVPLHFQPEASTCPTGGVFNDQELIVELLAAKLPLGMRLYVKEHPAQGELCRSREFYETLRQIPSVTLVPRNFDTFSLNNHSLAVATVTGTAAFEALFRGKPVLMFGHRFFQFAPGVMRIRTAQDCEKAMEHIQNAHSRPTLQQMRLFLKAMEETGVTYAGGPPSPHEPLSKEEKAPVMGEYIGNVLAPFFAQT